MSSNNNRADGLIYDRSGNFLGSQPTPGFTYDAASRLKSAGSVCYQHNAESIRMPVAPCVAHCGIEGMHFQPIGLMRSQ